MASLDFLQTRFYASEAKVGRVVDDTPVAIRIKHIGTGTSTPTVVISDTSSTLTLTDGDGDATVIDLSAAAYNTAGEVVDYINGLSSWSCKFLDALRADASNDKWINGAVTGAVVGGEMVYDIKADTSAVAAYTYRVTVNRGIDEKKPSKSHRVILKDLVYYADLTAGANGVQIFEWDNVAKTETQIWQAAGVDTTATTHDLGDGITPGEGNDLIVRVTGTVVDSASGYLQAQYVIE
jgi:hypothetical protein